MIFYWLSLLAIIVLIILAVWLLVRTLRSDDVGGKKLNESCTHTSECTGGLVCSAGVCKVTKGEVCSSTDECAQNLECKSGICEPKLGKVSENCPCDTNHTCVNNICKVIVGGPCTSDSECSTGLCDNNICVVASLDLVTTRTMDNNSCSDTSRYTSSCKTDTDICYSSEYDTHSRHRASSSPKSFYSCSKTDCSKSKYYANESEDEYSEYTYTSGSTTGCDTFTSKNTTTIDMSYNSY